MRGLTRRWRLPGPEGTTGRVRALHLPALVERVLTARGLSDAETVQRFCEPRLAHLHDPSLLPNLDAAAHRLVKAIRDDETIAIYGDYDVDGITAIAMLHHVIRAAAPGARLTWYVPHRLEEGYGLRSEALLELRRRGVDLVVSVDCGITAVEEAKVGKAAGLDLIITDHHRPSGDELPDALIVHPGLPGSRYPFPELCGAGVAFKLAWRFSTAWCNSQRVSERLQKVLLDMLPLAALGTIADVVPLVDENRVIASFGLRLIKQTPLVGLRALIEASDLAGEHIDAEKIGFILGPRLNACGRMGHAADAVRLLTEASPEEAAAIAAHLTRLNRQRQETERAIADQASQLAEDAGMTGDDRRIIVLAHPSWHPGVIGIVCSRLVDRFGRPAVLLQHREDLCQGSARSIEEYSIYEGLRASATHLDAYGGHDAAAGLRLRPDRLEGFTEALTEHANARIEPAQLVPALTIDCDAELEELTSPVVQRIGALAPFGQANRRPVLRIRDAAVAQPPRPIGGAGRHLELRFRQDAGGRRRIMRGVWWGSGHLAARLAAGMRLDLAVEPKLNDFNGRVTVEAVVRDVKVHADAC